MARRAAPAAVVLLGLALAGTARGQDVAEMRSGVRFDAHVTFGWYRDLGGGLRVDIPVVGDGIIDGADDDLRITLGAEALWFFHHKGFGAYPLAGMQWNFYVSDEWSIFPEVGIIFLFGEREHYWRTFVAPMLGFGVRWHFNARNALLFRVSWPQGGQIGIVF